MEVFKLEYKFKYVNGHVEVYSPQGKFLFSADTESEARFELKNSIVEI